MAMALLFWCSSRSQCLRRLYIGCQLLGWLVQVRLKSVQSFEIDLAQILTNLQTKFHLTHSRYVLKSEKTFGPRTPSCTCMTWRGISAPGWARRTVMAGKRLSSLKRSCFRLRNGATCTIRVWKKLTRGFMSRELRRLPARWKRMKHARLRTSNGDKRERLSIEVDSLAIHLYAE